ncbi:carbohydrate 4-sulfotransferase 8 [Fistulifera solaris]|uniref:Carbohydrate 4-sulfotransferase 8 n=1 Tax=Fistulifera solaris TaxID=1519565 RepID=A0A1Z5JHM7_FISSO|nr:carbohydrate 4-sulfotransferase 8 [Fistulifera solaris]|eukprot:GAX13362.1 carbohydrate 4-sulfotransferase 8 [Fistulifera solaris]
MKILRNLPRTKKLEGIFDVQRKMNPSFLSLLVLATSSLAFFALNVYQLSAWNASSRAIRSSQQVETSRIIHHVPIQMRRKTRGRLVQPGDFIYYKDDRRWDSAPIVIESHKLVFFTIPKVGCTVWKQLFRRMEGYSDWQDQDGERLLPHNPNENGLKYLYDYPIDKANEIMTSPKWTKAMMVREPKQRFLSAFLDKAVSNDHAHIMGKCCQFMEDPQQCVDSAQTASGFLNLIKTCEDDHWRAQNDRVDYKYWPYIDMVLHVEKAEEDAKRLLQKIGAWDEFGQTGWSKDHQSPIFGNAAKSAGDHATWSQWQVWKWYTPEVERQVEAFYRADYENPLFNFTTYECFTCVK